MARFCSNCGTEIPEGSSFCPKCGNEIGGTTIINNYNNESIPRIKERSILTSILLSIITCGIYGIYWFIVMTDDANFISDEKNASGALAFVFSLLTCGIYFLYWSFKMGEKLYKAGKKYNKPIGDNSILYLILPLFGLGIVNYCLIQNDLNKFAE